MVVKDGILMRMMRIKIFLAFMIPVLAVSNMAQSKQFTLDDLIPGGKTYKVLQPLSLTSAWWGNRLIRIEKDKCSILNQRINWEPLLSLADIKDAIKAQGLEEPKGLTLLSARFPNGDKTELVMIGSNYLFSYDWKLKRILRWQVYDEAISYQDFSNMGGSIAYNQNNDLFVDEYLSQKGQVKHHRISSDGGVNLVYGQSVHRNEFGINKGTFWSPDGRSLCFYQMDQSMVADYPLVDISTRIATLQPIKYPMAGETSHKVSIGVYNTLTRQTVWLQTGDNTDQYYTGITWSPDSKKIFLYHLNRDQNRCELQQFNAETGVSEGVIYEEYHQKYVEPQHGLAFLPWDSDKFIYWSQKTGYDNLYLYSLKEKRTLRNLTAGHDGVVLELLGFNAKTKSIIVNTTWTSPIQHNFYRVSVESGKAQPLGSAKGIHSGKLSADGSLLIDTWTSHEVPRQVDYINTATGKSVTLLVSYDQWNGYDVPEISCGMVKAADGHTDLYYRLIKPTHFDPNKKYPAVVYVYGGPHTRLVTDSWGYGYRGWEIYMAQLGYVVFVLDGRGSSERGRDFENVTFRHLGREEMKDQMQGVRLLSTLPYVDSNRLGVHGWSYGGFMTTNLMLTYPEVFKVGVAGGPVIDWSLYEVMYGERYMDTPQTNPDGYKENNLCLRAGDLKGRLLIIFGYNDPVCVPQHTLSFIRACETAGTHPDLLTYPGDEHNMQGADRIHLHEHITRYFEDHLK